MALDFSQVRPINYADLLDLELRDADSWLEPGVLPKRGMLLFGGLAKIGKSFLALELGRALALGESPFGCSHIVTPQPCRVLVLEQELGRRGLQKRGKKFLAEERLSPEKMALIQQNYFLDSIKGFKIDSIDGPRQIIRMCRDVGANVLVLDPINKFHALDENSNTEIEKLFGKLAEIMVACEDYDLSLVMSHHFGKPSRDPDANVDPFSPYNFRGASKWYDAPDTLVTCVHQPSSPEREEDKWWYVRTKWELRHGDLSPDHMRLAVNEFYDLRVRQVPEKTINRLPPTKGFLEAIPLSDVRTIAPI